MNKENALSSIISCNYQVIKFKYLYLNNDGGVWGEDPVGSDNDKIVLRSTEQTIDGLWKIENPAKRDLSNINYTGMRILEGDILMTKSSGSKNHIGKTTLANDWFNNNECYFSNFLQRIRVKAPNNPKIFWYVLNSNFAREQFKYQQNSTVGLGNISEDNIANLYVPFLTFDLQKKIVGFLDSKTSEIKSLIDNLNKQIESLKEYKKSLIYKCVTKGLDDSVPLKDSGIEWIGLIPENWKIIKGKYCFASHKEIVGGRSDEFGRLSITLGGIIKRSKSDSDGLQPSDFSTYQIVRDNQLIFRLIDLQNTNRGRRVGLSPFTGIVSPAYIILGQTSKCNMKYYEYYYFMIDSRQLFNTFGNDGVRSSLNADDLLNLLIIVPPFNEQNKIANYLEKQCKKIDDLIDCSQNIIDKLNEYQKSLIYEYVTGKKEVV